MNQSEFLAITCNLFKARGKGCDWFCYCFSLIKNLREIFKPISKTCSHRNRVITFDSHLKAALKNDPQQKEKHMQ